MRRSKNLRAHWYAGCTLEVAPTHPCTFHRAQDRFVFQNARKGGENHIHGKERDNEWHHLAPGTKRQRGEQKQIHHRSDGHKDDLEKPDTRQTKPAKRAIVPVEYHVAMFPKTLQRAVGPAKTLSRQCAHAFWRLCPRDRIGHVNDPLLM